MRTRPMPITTPSSQRSRVGRSRLPPRPDRTRRDFVTPKVKPIPDDYTHVTPYLCCKNAAGAIEFYKSVFAATELMRIAQPDGKVGHAEIKIGESIIMLADEFAEMNFRSPQSLGGSPVSILLYVENVDAVVEKAVAAGSKLQRPVK